MDTETKSSTFVVVVVVVVAVVVCVAFDVFHSNTWSNYSKQRQKTHTHGFIIGKNITCVIGNVCALGSDTEMCHEHLTTM